MSGDDVMPKAIVAPHKSYSVERLPNGLIRGFSRASKLSSCFNPDGTFRHGDLRPSLRVSNGVSAERITLADTLRWLDELDCRDRPVRAAESNHGEERTAEQGHVEGTEVLCT